MFLKLIPVFVLLLIHGCARENVQTQKTGQDCEPVNPINDLVAFMDPVQSKLFVLPEHRENVLKRLGAEPLGNEIYTMQSFTVNGKNFISKFTISPINTAAQILLYVNELEKLLRDYYANKDTARGVLIHTFRDSSGTFYRVYKDAECRKVSDSSVTPCIKQVVFVYQLSNEIDSPMYRYVPKETGRYVKTEYLEVKNCVKGGNYCVEALIVTRKTYICNDVNCSQILDIIPGYDYSCIK